ncbi:hypothetical protein [Taibaiella helva]|uniref:hypothetical protein n=1 Tax=Taibaiella helva TaxID=2301235 RepID=UPI000E589758|nr:hypothetical protein [Taibaiella helva]
MEKKLHTSLPVNLSILSLPDPHHTIQQAQMEEEFSAELAVLQQQKMMPRPEAVAQLLQMIAQQSVAEQH